MINKPLKKNSTNLNDIDEDLREFTFKVMGIQNILTNETPNDKAFNKHYCTYLIEYIELINKIDSDVYDDNMINLKISALYNKIFKNRRY